MEKGLEQIAKSEEIYNMRGLINMKLITVRSDSRVTAHSTSYTRQLFSCQHINLVSTMEMILKKLYVDKLTDKAAHDSVALF